MVSAFNFLKVLLIVIIVLCTGAAQAIPVDLSGGDSERLEAGLSGCRDAVEKRFGVRFSSFANYDVSTAADAFVVSADIISYTGSGPPPSTRPDANTRYFQCKATLKAEKWQIDIKPFVVKAKENGIFEPPRLDGYRFEVETHLDMDSEAGIETKGQKWVNEKGQIILKFMARGKTWAWGVLGNPADRGDFENNYSLVDSDGDGVFDEKYPVYIKFGLPGWLKKEENNPQAPGCEKSSCSTSIERWETARTYPHLLRACN